MGLQETLRFQIDFIRDCFPQVEETGLSREGDSSGEVSSIPVDRDRYHLVDSETFWLSDTPDIHSTHWGNSLRRICSWARLRNPPWPRAQVLRLNLPCRTRQPGLAVSGLPAQPVREPISNSHGTSAAGTLLSRTETGNEGDGHGREKNSDGGGRLCGGL